MLFFLVLFLGLFSREILFDIRDVRSGLAVLPLLFSRRAASRDVLPGFLEVKHTAVLTSRALCNLQACSEKSGY